MTITFRSKKYANATDLVKALGVFTITRSKPNELMSWDNPANGRRGKVAVFGRNAFPQTRETNNPKDIERALNSKTQTVFKWTCFHHGVRGYGWVALASD